MTLYASAKLHALELKIHGDENIFVKTRMVDADIDIVLLFNPINIFRSTLMFFVLFLYYSTEDTYFTAKCFLLLKIPAFIRFTDIHTFG